MTHHDCCVCLHVHECVMSYKSGIRPVTDPFGIVHTITGFGTFHFKFGYSIFWVPCKCKCIWLDMGWTQTLFVVRLWLIWCSWITANWTKRGLLGWSQPYINHHLPMSTYPTSKLHFTLTFWSESGKGSSYAAKWNHSKPCFCFSSQHPPLFLFPFLLFISICASSYISSISLSPHIHPISIFMLLIGD